MSGPLLPLAVALAGAYGVFLLYTALVFGWRGTGVGPGRLRSDARFRTKAEQWLAQAGLEGVGPAEFLTVMVVLFVVGAGLTFASWARSCRPWPSAPLRPPIPGPRTAPGASSDGPGWPRAGHG